jgi:hypothetical protein
MSNDHISKRSAAKNTWIEKFDAEKNYTEFASKLNNLLA